MKDLNPCKLRELTPQQRQYIIDWLGTTYDEDIVGKATLALESGLDILLEALGREGHEFT